MEIKDEVSFREKVLKIDTKIIFKHREKACKEINEKYGLDIKIERRNK